MRSLILSKRFGFVKERPWTSRTAVLEHVAIMLRAFLQHNYILWGKIKVFGCYQPSFFRCPSSWLALPSWYSNFLVSCSRESHKPISSVPSNKTFPGWTLYHQLGVIRVCRDSQVAYQRPWTWYMVRKTAWCFSHRCFFARSVLPDLAKILIRKLFYIPIKVKQSINGNLITIYLYKYSQKIMDLKKMGNT